MKLRLFLCLTLFAVGIRISPAQNPRGIRMSGTVVDAITNRPLAGVVLSATGDQGAAPTTTDSHGRFVLTLASSVGAGEPVRIHLEKDGYVPLDQDESASEEPTRHFEMQPVKQATPRKVSSSKAQADSFVIDRGMAFLSFLQDANAKSDWWITYLADKGRFASPVALIQYASITSMLPTEERIKTYSVSVMTTCGWTALTPIYTSTVEIWWASEGLQNAFLIDFQDSSLDSKLRSPIPARGTISGFWLFDTAQQCNIPNGAKIRYRYTLTTFTGINYDITTPEDIANDKVSLDTFGHTTGPTFKPVRKDDISSLPRMLRWQRTPVLDIAPATSKPIETPTEKLPCPPGTGICDTGNNNTHINPTIVGSHYGLYVTGNGERDEGLLFMGSSISRHATSRTSVENFIVEVQKKHWERWQHLPDGELKAKRDAEGKLERAIMDKADDPVAVQPLMKQLLDLD
jgi:hypothetical protein